MFMYFRNKFKVKLFFFPPRENQKKKNEPSRELIIHTHKYKKKEGTVEGEERKKLTIKKMI